KVTDGCRVLPRTRTWHSLAHSNVQPLFRVGRYEGTERFLGRRAPCSGTLPSPSRGGRPSISVWCSHPISAPAESNHVRIRYQRPTTPGPTRRKKSKKTALRRRLSLDTISLAHPGWQPSRVQRGSRDGRLL